MSSIPTSRPLPVRSLILPGKLWMIFAQCQVWDKVEGIPFQRYAIQLYFDLSTRGNQNIWKFPKPFVQRPVSCELGKKFAFDLRAAGIPLDRLPNRWLDGQDLLVEIPHLYPVLFPDDWYEIPKDQKRMDDMLKTFHGVSN